MSERTYVFDNGEGNCGCGGNTALLASLLGGRQQNDPMAMAAMMNGGMNGQWNNPFIYLVWMMFANRFFGNGEWGNGNGQCNTNAQLEALREQMNTNQNSNLLMDAVKGNNAAIGQLAGQLNCDFGTLNSAICDVRSSIDKVAGQVGFSAERVINAGQMGDANIISNLNQCCCTLRDAITQQGYQNQLATVNQTNTLQGAINFVNSSVERGFAQTAYETQQQTCELKNAIAAQTTLINDKFCQLEMREMQNKIDSLRAENQNLRFAESQQAQNNYLISQLQPVARPAYLTCSPYQAQIHPFGFYGYNGYGYNGNGCGCNSGCGNNCGGCCNG